MGSSKANVGKRSGPAAIPCRLLSCNRPVLRACLCEGLPGQRLTHERVLACREGAREWGAHHTEQGRV